MTLPLLHLLIANESLVLVINSDVIDNDESYLFRDNNDCLFRDVESVQEFSDILVFNCCWLLNSCSRFWDIFDVVAIDVKFVLLGFGDFDSNAGGHWDFAEEFLAKEVANFEGGAAIDNGTVDREMSVGGSEFVTEAEGDTLETGIP